MKVRVSLEGEGYRDTARTTEIELGSIERDEVSCLPTRPDGLKDRAPFRRPTLVAFATVLPALFLAFEMSHLPERNQLPFHLEWPLVFLLGLGVWVATYRKDKRVSQSLTEAADHDAPDVVERTAVTVRPSQSVILVGSLHRDETGEDREVQCVRVEDSVVDRRKTLRADYVDGSSGVFLADLSEEELAEVCACTRAHNIEVL